MLTHSSMPKDPERQRLLASRLRQSEARLGLLADAPASEKLDSWLGHLFSDHPRWPWELALVQADGTRRVIDPRVPIWVLPAITLAIGAGFALTDEERGRGIIIGTLCALMAVAYWLKQARAERHLLFDGPRRLAVVYRGHRVLVEIPFDDIDAIFVEVEANPGYADRHRVLASIGPVSLLLTRSLDEVDALATADAIAELVGIPREPKLRRKVPAT